MRYITCNRYRTIDKQEGQPNTQRETHSVRAAESCGATLTGCFRLSVLIFIPCVFSISSSEEDNQFNLMLMYVCVSGRVIMSCILSIGRLCEQTIYSAVYI